MEFPHGHHHRHHTHRDEREEEEYPPPAFDPHRPPPPPPSYYGEYEQPPPPPPPQVYHTSHHVVGGGGESYPDPSPPMQGFNYSDYPPPPQTGTAYATPSTVQHVSYESESNKQDQHHYRPHMPSFLHHHTQHQQSSEISDQKPTVRLFSKAETNYSLTIRDGKLILAPSDPSDPFQHWIKDEKYSTRVKDEEGFPSFALINKATGQAMKHSIGATHPVQLISYNSNILDESILWTQSKDLGDGFRTIRMVNNIRLNVDAFNGDKNHGGVHDGTTIVLWEWKKGDNQRWKIIPYCKSLHKLKLNN